MNFLVKIPILGPLFSFSPDICKTAFRELFFLWILSTVPIIISVFSIFYQGAELGEAIKQVMSIKALFLYTAAFLSPFLYTVIERLIYPKKDGIYDGAIWVFLYALIILIFSAWAYENSNFAEGDFVTWSLIFYISSIYCWFLAIADSRKGAPNYSNIVNNDTDAFLNATKH